MDLIDILLLINFVFVVLAFILIRKKGYSVGISLLLSLFLGFLAFPISFILKKKKFDPLASGSQSSKQDGSIKAKPIDRSVAINVSQHSGVSKPIGRIIDSILSEAGITIDLDGDADSNLSVEIKATALSGLYGLKGSTVGTTYYTGAEVNGRISYHDPGMKRRLSKSFYATRNLPESVYMSAFHTNPSAAPINEAFNDSGFFPILVRMLRELYGSQMLIEVMNNEHYHKSWLEGIKDQEAFAAYIQASVSNRWRIKENAIRLLDSISPKWRQDIIPVYSKKLLTGTYVERQTAARVLKTGGWKPVNDAEKMSYWFAAGDWMNFESAGTSVNQFLISNLNTYDPYSTGEDQIESFANAIKTLITINKGSLENFAPGEGTLARDQNFGLLVTLSELNDEVSKEKLNTLLLIASKENQPRLFSILERVGWEPEKEAGAWFWLERGEWDKAGSLGKVAIRPCLEYVADEKREKYDRTRAAGAIGLTGDKSFSAEIIELAKTTDWDISRALCSALIDLDPENLKNRMFLCLSESSSDSCAELGQEILDWLIPEIHDKKWRFHAIRALGKIGGPRAGEALGNLLNDENSVGLHDEAVIALGESGDAASARHLIPWLSKPDFYARKKAAISLAQIKDPETVANIIPLLASENQGILLTALLALGWKGNDHAVQPLLDSLLKTSDADERKKIIEALISIRVPALEKIFVEQLSKPDPEIQYQAAKALVELGKEPEETHAAPFIWAAKGDFDKCRDYGSQAAPAMIEAWKQVEKNASYPSTYFYTAHKEALTALDQILVDMKPESVLPLLETFKTNKKLRFPLMRVFIAMKEAAAEPLLILSAQTKDTDIRIVASHILRFGDHSIISALQNLTTHPEKIIRQSAMKVLGWHPDPSSVEPILKTLFQEEDYVVRGVGVETLGLIGGMAAVEALIKALDDPSDHVRIVAAKALSRLGDPASTETLISMLQDEDYNYIILAIKGLGNIGNAQAKQALELLEVNSDSSIIINEIKEAQRKIKLDDG